MNAISPLCHHPLDETAADQRDRHRRYTYELAELNMQAARVAAADIAEQHLTGDRAPTAADPTLALSRATRGVAIAVNLERRICNLDVPAPTPRASATDPRRATLGRALHAIAAAEPDPAVRAALHRDVTDCIETALLDDPDGDVPLPDTFGQIARELGLDVDFAKIPDEFLGIAPRDRRPPQGPPGPAPTNDSPLPPKKPDPPD